MGGAAVSRRPQTHTHHAVSCCMNIATGLEVAGRIGQRARAGTGQRGLSRRPFLLACPCCLSLRHRARAARRVLPPTYATQAVCPGVQVTPDGGEMGGRDPQNHRSGRQAPLTFCEGGPDDKKREWPADNALFRPLPARLSFFFFSDTISRVEEEVAHAAGMFVKTGGECKGSCQ